MFWKCGLHLQVRPTQLGPVNRASPYLRTTDRIQSPKRCVLKDKQGGVLDKDKTMDSVQKRNICTNVPLSQNV
jgi:hypothetical protein